MTLIARRGRVGGDKTASPSVAAGAPPLAPEKCSRAVTVIPAVAAASTVWTWRVNSVQQTPCETLVSGEVAVRADRGFRRAGRPRVAEAAHRPRMRRRGCQRGPGGHDPAAELRGQRPRHLAGACRRIWGRPLAPVGSVPPGPGCEPAALHR